LKHTIALIASLIFLLSVSNAFCGEAEVGKEVQEKKHQPKPGIKSIKQAEPNIPQEYKELEKMYNQYWGFFMKKEYEKAYAMESSAYRKSNPYPKTKYESLLPSDMKMTAVMALKVEKMNEKEVVVKGNYYYELGALKSVRPFSDTWTKEKAVWMHVPTEGQFRK
jgi:hypothetical protein